MRDLGGALATVVGVTVGLYSHPRMPMFSRALMWDSSSCKAKNGEHDGCGSTVPRPLA